MKDFTNRYQLSKTLRFELKPIGKTLEHIQEKGLLTQDEQRAESYKKVKKIIDRYHKVFIDACLQNIELSTEDILLYETLYFKNNKDDKEKKELQALQKKLRKQVSDCFTKTDDYKRLFGKELIKEDLDSILESEQEKNWVTEFDNFTTYFSGFHENRKNMYVADEKSTAVAYRLIHENLPKFLANKKTFDKINTEYPQIIDEAKKEIEPELQGISVEDMFTYKYFNQTLKQTDIDLYNLMLGGRADEKSKIQGLNEKINLYRQKNGKTKKDIPNLTVLFKQILSDKESFSFIAEKFENPNEVLQAINNFYTNELLNWCEEDQTVNVFLKIAQTLSENQTYDRTKIFLKNDTTLTDLSKQIFNNWATITQALYKQFYTDNPKLKPSETNDKKIEKIKFYSIAEIELALKDYCADNDDLKEIFKENILFTYFQNLKQKDKEKSLLETINIKFLEVENLLNTEYTKGKSLISDDPSIEKIKAFLDALMDFLHFIKPLASKGFEGEKDETFYVDFLKYYKQLELLATLYDKVRNYLTQKPYSIEKFKLNFESSYFLSGWLPQYDTKAGLIYQYKTNYYLAINNKKLTTNEIEYLKNKNSTNIAERIVLDFQKPDNTNTPRMFIRSKGTSFAPAVAEYNLPIHDILDIYDSGKFKTEYRKINPIEYKESLHKLIDYFKLGFSKHSSYKHFKFNWKKTSDYLDIADFYQDTIASCYEVKTENTNWDNLLEFVNQGKLYLFQIYNKDFSEYSKGKPNLHTMYWKELFSEANRKDVVYKLNGQAEIFFREKSLQYAEETLQKGHHYEALKNKFNYPIISKKRFAYDKFQFHVPITLNFKAKGRDNINQPVLENIQNTPENDFHIIGIDRGERHLLYLTMIDAQGNIKKQYSLNDIVNEYQGKTYTTNYHSLLADKEKNRDESRKTWKTIETIKELKEGYISQVVHQVAKMMVENKAIVVLEDLNFGFKKGRFKVEKQVYQKFEKMLIDKLNYYVDKNKNDHEVGGTLNALQLTSKFTSFKELGKQSGFLFYVPAWNTSKIDPTTGFVNYFYTQYENVEKAQKFFSKFSNIRWNESQNYFEFHVNKYSDFNPKAEETQQNWIICTHGTRLLNARNPEKNNEWDTQEINITNDLKALFSKKKIDFTNDLQTQITKQTEKDFFEKLYHLFKLTLQMRNSRTGTEEDYLVSPVINVNGTFFDSRTANQAQPKDADANGAYNIARKGLLLIDKIKKADLSKKPDLSISNKEWLNFAQKAPQSL